MFKDALPLEVRAHFDIRRSNSENWERMDLFFAKLLQRDSPDFVKLKNLLDGFLDGVGLELLASYAVYNPTLVR